jgi:hypothetical protein
MASDTAVQLTLTPAAIRSILERGYGQTFTHFSASDMKQAYDVTASVNLESQFPGGSRTIVTDQKVCRNANDKPLTKVTPSDKELSDSTKQLQWKIENSDCDVVYTGSNAKITVNLRTYINYLLNSIGTDNYNYNSSAQVTLIDNISATQLQFEPSTYTYDAVDTVTGLDIKYTFDSKESARNYTNSNAYYMSVNSGTKSLVNNTNQQKFWSPFILAATTPENQPGRGYEWKLGITPISYGYVGILSDDRRTEFKKSDYYTVSQIESMSPDELRKKFRTFLPAAITDNRNSNESLYIFGDFTGTYAGGVDNLQTMAYRFTNLNGKTLLEGITDKAINHILGTFTESEGIYTREINLAINNKEANGYSYKSNQINGGNIDIILRYDSTETSTSYYDIVDYE